MRINLLVIRTRNPQVLKAQYERLGLTFTYHQHGKGPFHYSSECDGLIFEIYPLKKSMEKADNSVRLGFEVQDVESTIRTLEDTDWKIVSRPQKTEWGIVAVIQDIDGRKVELKGN